MTEEMVIKFENAVEDSNFSEKFVLCNSESELKELLNSRGIIVSENEVKELCCDVRNKLIDNKSELDEQVLDDVNGGFLGATVVALFVAVSVYVITAKKIRGNLWR